MNVSNRFQKQRYQASQSAHQAVLEAERARGMLHQAIDLGHPGDIQYAQQKLQEALDQLLQTQSYTTNYISVAEQEALQQSELMLRQEYQTLLSNDISDLTDQSKDED